MKQKSKKQNKVPSDIKFNNSINFKITKVNPIKFFIGRFSLSELELKTLQLEVAEGKKPSGIMVKDEKGNMASIQPDGRLDQPLHGLDAIQNINMKIAHANRLKEIGGWNK